MCQIREPHNTDLQRYSILNELLSSNQCLYYKASCWCCCSWATEPLPIKHAAVLQPVPLLQGKPRPTPAGTRTWFP